MTHRKRNTSLASAFICLIVLTTACASTPSNFADQLDGKVVESGTHKPIPGTIVIARWYYYAWHTVCQHVETTTTDDAGRYHFSRWHENDKYYRDLHEKWIETSVYKPGYQQAGTWNASPNPVFVIERGHEQGLTIYYLQSVTGTVSERFKYLDGVISNTSCGNKDSYRNLYRVSYAVYEEALSIAQTAEEKKHVERFRELAQDALVNRNKPTKYDERGRFINVDPKDSFKPEDLK